ncbi:MAG: hypothetical protein AAGU02_09820 [Lawsonibacter sp.]
MADFDSFLKQMDQNQQAGGTTAARPFIMAEDGVLQPWRALPAFPIPSAKSPALLDWRGLAGVLRRIWKFYCRGIF